MSRFEGAAPGFQRLCYMLDENVYQRRVGNDVNRAVDGERLRRSFLDDYLEADIDPRITNEFMARHCTWLEMLIALSESLDYIYELGVREHFIEMLDNLGLHKLLSKTDPKHLAIDQDLVDAATNRVDFNQFDSDGRGGLFPLVKRDHPDQREVEIWDQHAAYFRERLEGVMWTSTN